MKKRMFAIIGVSVFIIILALIGCEVHRLTSLKYKFLVIPYELREQLDVDRASIRECLFKEPYRLICVERDGEHIVPSRHYWFETTFSYRVHPIDVSFNKPLFMGQDVIVDSISTKNGIAIKKEVADKWRVYWLNEDGVEQIKKKERLVLPPFEKLSYLTVKPIP